MFAVITFGGVLTVIGLVVLLIVVMLAMSQWVGSGTFLGWYMANVMWDAAGHILAAIIQAIAEMRD